MSPWLSGGPGLTTRESSAHVYRVSLPSLSLFPHELALSWLLSQKGRLCEGILRILRGSSDGNLQNTLASSEENTAPSLTKPSPTSCWNIAVYSVSYHFLSIKSPASLSCAQHSLQQKGSAVFLKFKLKEIYTGMVKTSPLNRKAGIQKGFFPNSAQADLPLSNMMQDLKLDNSCYEGSRQLPAPG